MSQPTRTRTTGAATRTPRKLAATPNPTAENRLPAATDAPAAPGEPTASDGAASGALTPGALARTLRAVAAELERDPALARRVADALATPSAADDSAVRVGNTVASAAPPPVQGEETGGKGPRINHNFRPKLVTGASPELGAGIPDPFALYTRLGEDDLRAALADLRLGTLRAIARQHGLDPKGTLSQQNDAEKLRAAILKAAKKGRK